MSTEPAGTVPDAEPKAGSDGAVDHPLFARVMAVAAEIEERRGGAERRRRLLDGLSGRVAEIGTGSGVSFRSYPDSVTELVAIEPEAHMRELSARAAADLPFAVQVVDALAGELPLPDASLDAVVVSCVLCSVPSQADALREFRRVLKPGGTLRFFEHVVSPKPAGLAIQRAAKATFWPRVFGGCDPTRDTEAAIRAAGFEIEWVERFPFAAQPVSVVVAPHILGHARVPA